MSSFVWLLALVTGLAAAQAGRTPGGLLVVVNQKEHALVLVDPTTGQEVARIQTGVNGHEVAISPDGAFAYVPVYGDSGVGRPGTDGREIDIIDLRARQQVGTIDLGKPLRPHKVEFGPDGLLYVTGELARAVEVIDVQKRVVLGEVPTGANQSHVFAMSHDGSRIYTSNVGEGSVSVLDVKARKVLAVIPLTKRVQRMALSNDGRWAFTSDWDQPRFAVIDTQTNALSRWVATTGTPYVTMPAPDGKSLLIAETRDGKGLLEVVDLASWKVVRSYPLASAQNGGFLLHGGLVYLSEPLAGTIEVLDLANWKLRKPIVMTLGVDGLGWTGE